MIQINKINKARFVDRIAIQLNHINRVTEYYHLADEDIFYDLFSFVKEEYLKSNNYISVSQLHGNKPSYETTMIDVLADYIKADVMVKIQAMLDAPNFWGMPVEYGEPEQSYILEGKEIYISDEEKRLVARHILNALNAYESK